LIAGSTPSPNISQRCSCPLQELGLLSVEVEILVSDRIAPSVQLIQPFSPALVERVKCVDVLPDRHVEPREIVSDASAVRVTTVKFSPLRQRGRYHRPKPSWVDLSNYERSSFAVQIPAEPLKLSGQREQVCVVDLIGRVTSTPSGSTNRCVRVL